MAILHFGPLSEGVAIVSQFRLQVALALDKLHNSRTQGEIALLSGIDATIFSKIVRGWRQPTPGQRRSIAETLGKAENELFEVEEPVDA